MYFNCKIKNGVWPKHLNNFYYLLKWGRFFGGIRYFNSFFLLVFMIPRIGQGPLIKSKKFSPHTKRISSSLGSAALPSRRPIRFNGLFQVIVNLHLKSWNDNRYKLYFLLYGAAGFWTFERSPFHTFNSNIG